MKNLLLILFLSLIFSQWSLGAAAQSPSQMTVNQKIQRLEATVEELTLRLAEKIQENQRMEIVSTIQDHCFEGSRCRPANQGGSNGA